MRIFVRGKEVSVLMYHSVENSQWKYGVTPLQFERHLKYIKENMNPVSFADVVAYTRGEKELPHKSVAVTFDDGYEDTISVVAPLLAKYRIPATVFLTTNFFPMEKLGNLPRPAWEGIERVAQEGWVTFEVHGESHTNFTELSVEALTNELVRSKDDIQRHTGYTPQFVAYPAGRVNRDVEQVVKTLFAGGCVITEGLVKPHTNPYRIKRIQVDRSISFTQFKIRMTKAIDYVKFIKSKMTL